MKTSLKESVQIPKLDMVRPRLPLALLATAALAAVGAPAAFADTSVSSNWAGYASHRHGVRFSEVHADWVQPPVTCTAPIQTYSAAWVGIGGYAQNSQALEQIGTENDCNATGGSASSAWYELVPAPSVPIHMAVRPGDAMAASVVIGKHNLVTLSLRDLTTHKLFKKTLKASVIDRTSADWIIEAPSACISATACQTLPLADFGTTAFGIAYAKSTTGKLGPISGPGWGTTQITLAAHARRFVAYNASGGADGGAAPSPLAALGSAFSVTYQQPTQQTQTQTNPFFSARRSADVPTYLVH